ncbi:hypothetical protein NA57DRAFT_72014 [Rhizodiscina lignyota]|uniref:Inner kinetochore subunit AME1 domain-containing protein n=1 Tax=Rhizodiscina lignyota TaxID=1504668 RepID=A0A9P4M9T4_9PEZI|nr:hypothetical protein NA57DRAFT_72014 [Rhizodiscina lignyota]
MVPNDKQERRRMRERGAGITRELKNTSFAFTFGAPQLQPQRSSRRTPQPLPQQPSSRKTPKTATRRQSARKTPGQKSISREGTAELRTRKRITANRASVVPSTGEREARASSKRLSRTLAERTESPNITPSVTGKRKRSTPIVQPPQETDQDELEQEDEMEAIFGRRSWGEQIPAERRRSSLHSIHEDDAVEDELEADDREHHVMTETKRRISANRLAEIAPQSPNKQQQNSVGKGKANALEIVKTPFTTRRSSSNGKDAVSENAENAEPGQENDPETHSTFIKRMYKPRQPLVDIDEQAQRETSPSNAISRRESGKAPVAHMYGPPQTLWPASVVSPISEAGVDELDSFGKEHDITSTYNDISTQLQPTGIEVAQDGPSTTLDPRTLSATRLGLPRGTPFIETSKEPSTLLDREEDASPVRGRKRRRTHSSGRDTSTSRVSSNKLDGSSKSVENTRLGPEVEREGDESQTMEQQTARPRQNVTASTVPITVYRLSRPVTLDNDSDDDPLNDGPSTALSTRGLPAVNAVDVLSQITSELVEHMAETAHRLPAVSFSTSGGHGRTGVPDQPRPSSADLKRRRGILHHFQQSLSDALFDITAAVDAGMVLKSRLKGLTKEKVQLRDELLEVKRQREEVALSIDRVRREHGIWRKTIAGRDELSADLWDLEMAVKRGKEECAKRRERGEEVEGVRMGIEMLAGTVATEITSQAGGGLCTRVERFNDILEKAAETLEGRTA